MNLSKSKTGNIMGVLVIFLTILGFYCSLLEAKPILKDRRYMLVRAFPDSRSKVTLLHELRYQRRGLLIAFWRTADKPGRHVDIWARETSDTKLLNFLSQNKIGHRVQLENLTASQLVNITMGNIDYFDAKYQSLKGIYSELKRLAMGYPEIAKVKKIGQSYQNRDIYAIQIKKNFKTKKPLIFINCGIHGREWLAVSSCMRVVRRMIFNEKYDEEIKFIIDNFEIIFVPILNPDGYVYTRKTNRYWRKSRSTTDDKNCPGVDLNRNFIFKWGGKGSSPDICDETYSGPRPFSERESLALARFLYSRRSDLKAFFDVHTFGQLLMYPWGYTRQKSFHWKTQTDVLSKISQKINWATGRNYKVGPASEVLYETAGDSTDWVYGFLGIRHSYGIELRPRMSSGATLSGFNQAASEIIPTARELFITIRETAKYVHQEANMKRTK